MSLRQRRVVGGYFFCDKTVGRVVTGVWDFGTNEVRTGMESWSEVPTRCKRTQDPGVRHQYSVRKCGVCVFSDDEITSRWELEPRAQCPEIRTHVNVLRATEVSTRYSRV